MVRYKKYLLLCLYLSVTLGVTITPYPNYIPKLVSELDHPNFNIREHATEVLMMHRWSEISSFLPECGSPEMVIRMKRIEREIRPQYYNTKFRTEDSPIIVKWQKYWW